MVWKKQRKWSLNFKNVKKHPWRSSFALDPVLSANAVWILTVKPHMCLTRDGQKRLFTFLISPSLSFNLRLWLFFHISHKIEPFLFVFFSSHTKSNHSSFSSSNMVVCHCGAPALVKTSWTSKNPGRRFYGCPRKVSRCDFFCWYDQQMCSRAMEVILGLLRSKNTVEASLKSKQKVVILRCLLVLSWGFFAFHVFC